MFKIFMIILLSILSINVHADAWAKKIVFRNDLKIELSESDLSVLYEKKNILKIVYTDFPPFIYEEHTSNNRVITGISKKLFDIFERKLPGVRFEWIRVPNIMVAIDLLKSNKADFIFNIDPEVALRYNIPVSDKSYFTSIAYPIINRADIKKWNSLKGNNNLYDIRAAVIDLSPTHVYLNSKFNNLNLLLVDSPSDSIAKVLSNSVDFTVMDLSQFGFYYKLFGIQNLTAIVNEENITVEKRIAISPFHPKLKNVIDTLIDSLTEEEKLELKLVWKKYEYNEPIVRTNVGILLFLLVLMVLNNMAWYWYRLKIEVDTEERITKKWITVATAIAQNKIEESEKPSSNSINKNIE